MATKQEVQKFVVRHLYAWDETMEEAIRENGLPDLAYEILSEVYFSAGFQNAVAHHLEGEQPNRAQREALKLMYDRYQSEINDELERMLT